MIEMAIWKTKPPSNPLLGRTANLDGAVALALKDPEEPDANAMFEAIRLYDRLHDEKQPDEIFEVATISGTDFRRRQR